MHLLAVVGYRLMKHIVNVVTVVVLEVLITGRIHATGVGVDFELHWKVRAGTFPWPFATHVLLFPHEMHSPYR